MPSHTQLKGAAGERMVATWLKEKGYQILQANYRYQKAEIDLVAFLPTTRIGCAGELVFVEVKWRRHARFALPERAVTRGKQRLLVQAASAFIRERNLVGISCRFDVITLVGEGAALQIEHYESAFIAQ